jgi:polyphosphate glucokinase
MKVLVVDIGGTRVKALVSGQRAAEGNSIPGRICSRRAWLPKLIDSLTAGVTTWCRFATRAPVLRDRPIAEPHNLGRGWVGFDFEKAFERPVKVVNDAAMQALGSYHGGKMLFLGLGTGLGSALVVDGIVEPMELSHLPYRKRNYEHYVGEKGLKREGKAKWRRFVDDVVMRFVGALEPDDVVLGGGNVRLLKELPPKCRLGSNADASLGGFRLWKTSPDQADRKRIRQDLDKPGRTL